MNYKKMNPEEYAILKSNELKKYTDKIDHPSKDFLQFLHEYFTGNPMIRGRGEEDISVWKRLSGDELEIAKQMILDNLGYDSAYIRAIGIFKDKRGILLLENLIETHHEDRFDFERLLAARILYDWVGYTPYLKLLEDLLPNSSSWTKTNLDLWINGIDKALAKHYIFLMLRDQDSFVRWCTYDTFKRYFNLGVVELWDHSKLNIQEQQKIYKENKYYTGDDIYSDKELFETRLKELEVKISNLQ